MLQRTVNKMAKTINKLKNITLTQWSLTIILLAAAAFLSLPIIFIINHAFKPFNELFLFPPTFWVRMPTTSNFFDLFLRSQDGIVPFTRYLFNSIIVAVLTLVTVILSSCMAAYVLSKHKFAAKNIIMGGIMLALMFAAEVVAIPRYLIISWLNINNTYIGHILPFIASPVAVFLMKQFVDQIPNELIESAKLDGASEFRVFYNIVMPLAFPAVATISIFTFQDVWGNVEASTLFMQNETMKTLPYYMMSLTSGVSNVVAGQGMAAAASLLIFLPNLIIFLAFQKRIMETMLHSGVK